MDRSVLINGKWPVMLPDNSADEWEGNMAPRPEGWEGPRLDRLKLEIDKIQEKQGRPAIVMYIGAYKGDMPALIGTWGAQQVLVEGTEGFWPLIRMAWHLNGLPNPLGCFSGLMSTETTSDLSEFELSRWPERSVPFVEGTTGFASLAESRTYFPEITIDDLLERINVVPDIITMDIEGSELAAMYGGIRTLEAHHPSYMISIHPEFMFHNYGTYERELHDLVNLRGYKREWVDYDHEHHWWFSYGD